MAHFGLGWDKPLLRTRLGEAPTTAAEIACRLVWQIRLTTACSRNATAFAEEDD